MAKIRNPLMVINVTESTTPVEQETYLCRVVDWEGTILKEEWLPSGATFTMPADPTYEGLVFDGWSGPVDVQDNAVVVEDMDLIFGAMYHTASGLTEIDIELTEATGLTVVMGSGETDWGDGVSNRNGTHTYAEYGKYTIKYSGTWAGSNPTSTGNLFGRGNNYYVKSIRLSENVGKNLTLYMFGNCKEMETFLLPYGTTSGRLGLLSNCTKLKCLIFPTTVTSIQSGFKNLGCRHIVIPNTVTSSLGDSFENSNVEYISININAGIGYLLQNSYMLKRAFIKSNSISGSNTFQNSYKLEKVLVEIKTGTSLESGFCQYCRNLKEAEIKSNTLNAVYDLFNTCVNLEKAILPDSITTSRDLFASCYALKEVHLPDNLTTVNGNLFNQCQSLERVQLPQNLQKITGTFLDTCYNFDFDKLELPDSLTDIYNIGRICYSNAIKFPKNLVNIGNVSIYQYSRAYGIIEFPDSIITMGGVDSWSNAEGVIMPASLTTISSYYFGRDCPNIKFYDFSKVNVVPTLAYSAGYTFLNINPLCKIVVPDELYNEWIVATNWTAFQQYIVKASEYTGG